MTNNRLRLLSWGGSFLFALLIVIWYRHAFCYTINGINHYDYRLIATVLILVCFFTELCWRKMLCSIFEKMDSVARVDGVFCVCILCFCLLPISHLNFANIDTTENRTMAQFPTLWKSDGRIYEKFGRDVESWLNDHIGVRHHLLSVYQCLEKRLTHTRIETNRAFVGQSDWLFYLGDNSLQLFQNRLLFTDTGLMDIKQNLEQQKDWCSSQGIFYIVFVAPNKADVYGEFYPKGIQKVGSQDRVSLLKEHLDKEQGNITFLYPLEDLLAHKKDGLLYYKNDTHWSSLGAYWGYRTLMNEVQKNFPDINVLSIDNLQLQQSACLQGDLNNMLPAVPLSPYKDVFYTTPELPTGTRYSSNEEGGETQKRIRTVNSYGKYKAVVFRDSFSNALIPYLSESFHEVLYIWSHDLDPYAELIEQEKPNIVVHEIVSRYVEAMANKTPNWKSRKKEIH